ncbi:MAG: helix-turn-helix domain-containing protein [Deltaproteobacteria bacterium]|nr:helix-turn-helix domain-containing protein [Deltaproteobacteria bacterium]
MPPRPSRVKKGKPAHPALHRLIRRMSPTRSKLARRILEQSLEVLPHYRSLPAAARKTVYDNVLHHVSLFYRVTLEEGRPLTAAELKASQRNARVRASQGVPLGELLAAYQIGNSLVWQNLVACAGSNPAERSELLERVGTIFFNQTQIMTAVTEAYVEERESLSHFREQDVDDFFRLLLSEEKREGLLEIRAKSLGIRLDEPHFVAFFRPATATVAERSPVTQENVRRLLTGRTKAIGGLVARLPEGFAVLLPDKPDTVELADIARSLLGEKARLGIGGTGTDIAGLRRSAREALRAIHIGSLVHQDAPFHRYADLAVLDLVGIGSADAEAFVDGVLGPLVRSKSNSIHLNTLRELSRNGFRAKLAAAALSIHPHTLSYRLKQIHGRFGIDIDDAETRLRLYLALLILDAMAPSAP